MSREKGEIVQIVASAIVPFYVFQRNMVKDLEEFRLGQEFGKV